jgi:mannose-6-phosphate isomerase-like protein (cupin superfamily)
MCTAAVLPSLGMDTYSVTQLGPLDSWRDFVGGFRPDTTRPGRRVVDHEVTGRIIGLTANAYEPGEQAGYWHAHSVLEEVYVFLEGLGQMGLDDDIVDVEAGTVVMVPPGVMRTWRCIPESPTQLKWICIRAGQNPLPAVPDDAEPLWDIPLPW